MKLSVYNKEGKPSGEIELNDAVFALSPRQDIIARTILWQLAKRRAGTHKAKVRSEVAGSTKKIVRQKGSGGARHGSKRGAQFRGGGIIFGPVVRDHGFDLPKKVRKLALRMALSAKAKEGKLIVLDDFQLEDHKTTSALSCFASLNVQKALLIDGQEVQENMLKATLNLKDFDVLPQIGANVYDIVRKDQLILSADGVKALEERLK